METEDLTVSEFHLGFVNNAGNRHRGVMVPREVDLTVVFPPSEEASVLLIKHMKEQADNITAIFTLRFYGDDDETSFMIIKLERFWIIDLDLEMSAHSQIVTYQMKLLVASMNFEGAYREVFLHEARMESFEGE